MIMCSIPDDRKAAAVIRDTAMELFAERGVSGVTVREIASAAGFSPGLVIHHFGSKDGLRAAIDRHVVSFVDTTLAGLAHVTEDTGSATLVQLFATRLEQQPALVEYIRRLLIDGGPAGDVLFDRLFEATATGIRELVARGVVRPAQDEPARTAFLMANDLAVILLRRQIERAIGADPLVKDGLARWTAEVVEAYTNGVFAAVPSTDSTPLAETGQDR